MTVSTLVLAGLAAAVALAASTDFTEPSSSPVLVAPSPTSPAIADLDGDGDRDVAVASEGADAVTILINNGAGNLHERATNSPVATGDDPVAMVATDLDGDADPDLATADQLGHDMTILINNGSGGFHERSTSPEAAGSRPFALAAGDIDGDADQDLIVADTFDGVQVFRNNGAGNFSELGRARSTPAASPADWRSPTSTRIRTSTSRSRTAATTTSRSCATTAGATSSRRPLARRPTTSRSAWSPPTSTTTATPTSRSPIRAGTTSRSCVTTATPPSVSPPSVRGRRPDATRDRRPRLRRRYGHRPRRRQSGLRRRLDSRQHRVRELRRGADQPGEHRRSAGAARCRRPRRRRGR